MEKFLKISAVLLILICLLLSSSATQARAVSEGGGTINAQGVNLRSEPTTASGIITVLYEGDEVVVTDGEAPRESQTIQVGEGSRAVRMTNDSGCTITAIRVKDAAAEEFPAELTYEGLEVLPGDVIEFSFEPIEGAQAYEVRLTTDEEQTIVLRSLDLAGIAELSVLYKGGIGYVTYVDEETQQEVDTHDSAVQAQQEEDESMVTHDMETQLDPEE